MILWLKLVVWEIQYVHFRIFRSGSDFSSRSRTNTASQKQLDLRILALCTFISSFVLAQLFSEIRSRILTLFDSLLVLLCPPTPRSSAQPAIACWWMSFHFIQITQISWSLWRILNRDHRVPSIVVQLSLHWYKLLPLRPLPLAPHKLLIT